MPHQSEAQLNTDVRAFYEEVEALARRLDIENVVILFETRCMQPSGAVIPMAGCRFIGRDPDAQVIMLARAYGAARQLYDDETQRRTERANLAVQEGRGSVPEEQVWTISASTQDLKKKVRK